MAPAGTPLHVPYCFSYMRRGKSSKQAQQQQQQQPHHDHPDGDAHTAASGNTNNTGDDAAAAAGESKSNDGIVHPYENSIRTVATVSTVQEFWAAYNHLRRPNELPTTTDYHFFRDGIKPTWEDAGNARGGKWIVRLPKGLASRYWEEVILALVGGQFSGVPDGEICGLVISIRFSEDILGVWNRTAHDHDMIDRLRDAIKRVLQLPAHANMEYKPHQNSIQDKSSFRNTRLWKPSNSNNNSNSNSNSNSNNNNNNGGGGNNNPNNRNHDNAGTGNPNANGRNNHHDNGSVGMQSNNSGGRSDSRGRTRTSSWGEREKPKPRESDKAWR